MSDKKELNPSPKFPDGEYPQLSPNPNTHDGLVDNTDEKANTQVVNPGQVQEPKNLTLSDIIALILKYAPEGASGTEFLAPEYDSTATYKAGDMVIYDDTLYQAKADINTAEAWNSEHWDEKTLEEALQPYLNGKFVRIMNAPSSTTLTDEQIALIKNGIFINGTFLGLQNPVLFGYGSLVGGQVYGLIIGTDSNSAVIGLFGIYQKVISVRTDNIVFGWTGSRFGLKLNNDIIIKNKALPNYPENTAIGQYICRKGTLEYYVPVSQDGITSGDVIALDSNLGKALLDHLDVEINGHRCRYEYTDGNYVIYSSKAEADGGLKLQVNMISYNTTNGELSFNQMTFTPDN